MKQLTGAWPTMVTPFDDNLQIDTGAYRAVIHWYVEHGVGGLYANCLSSEMYHLDNTERLLLVREAVSAAGGRVPVAATGNLGTSLAEHAELCRRVADEGADVVMLVVPDFLESETDLEHYFLSLAEQVPAPLGLYECPVPRPFHLSVDLVARLAHTGRFAAYKETSCNLAKIFAHLNALRGTPLSLLQANTPYLLESVAAGAPGSMSIASIWLPDLVAVVIEKARAGDPSAARLQARLCAMELAQRAVHPLGTKYLLGKRGLPVAARGRAHPELAGEVLCALDYAASAWFDEQGELRIDGTHL
jgi:4-hydroxy-tetrahydrodipicolinate synthase